MHRTVVVDAAAVQFLGRRDGNGVCSAVRSHASFAGGGSPGSGVDLLRAASSRRGPVRIFRDRLPLAFGPGDGDRVVSDRSPGGPLDLSGGGVVRGFRSEEHTSELQPPYVTSYP